MGSFLKNREVMTRAAIILAFAVGLGAGYLTTPKISDGKAIDGNKLELGAYDILYPSSTEDAVIFYEFLPTEKTGTTEGNGRTFFVLFDSDLEVDRLVSIENSSVEWRKHDEKKIQQAGILMIQPRPTLTVRKINGKKKFIFTE